MEVSGVQSLQAVGGGVPRSCVRASHSHVISAPPSRRPRRGFSRRRVQVTFSALLSALALSPPHPTPPFRSCGAPIFHPSGGEGCVPFFPLGGESAPSPAFICCCIVDTRGEGRARLAGHSGVLVPCCSSVPFWLPVFETLGNSPPRLTPVSFPVAYSLCLHSCLEAWGWAEGGIEWAAGELQCVLITIVVGCIFFFFVKAVCSIP